MIESIFQNFRGKTKENCPEWIFSCSADGDAQLYVWEIVCPLEMYDDTDLDQLKIEVDAGVYSLASNQVEIFTNYTEVIRVLMYSEEEAYNAITWLSLNETETTPDEIIGTGCTMT